MLRSYVLNHKETAQWEADGDRAFMFRNTVRALAREESRKARGATVEIMTWDGVVVDAVQSEAD